MRYKQNIKAFMKFFLQILKISIRIAFVIIVAMLTALFSTLSSIPIILFGFGYSGIFRL